MFSIDSRFSLLLPLLVSTNALAEGLACGRDADCPGEEVCEAARCQLPGGQKAPAQPAPLPAPVPLPYQPPPPAPYQQPSAPLPYQQPPSPSAAPSAQRCVRQWVRVEGGQSKVRWCGRELDAEQLLVPEARPLFASRGGGPAFDLALAADTSSKVAAGVGVGLLGLSFTMLIGALPRVPLEGAGGLVVGVTSLLVLFGGSVGSLILHGIFSNEAIEHLHHAMDVLEQNSPRE